MLASKVKNPNGDPNPNSEIKVKVSWPGQRNQHSAYGSELGVFRAGKKFEWLENQGFSSVKKEAAGC